jgi:hypothetical protein
VKYVIICVDDSHPCNRQYVARAGSKHSYTPKLQNAEVFSSRDAAKASCCGNEIVIER